MNLSQTDREMLLIRLMSAVVANCNPTPEGQINLNVSVAMEMLDKVLVEFEVLKIRGKQ